MSIGLFVGSRDVSLEVRANGWLLRVGSLLLLARQRGDQRAQGGKDETNEPLDRVQVFEAESVEFGERNLDEDGHYEETQEEGVILDPGTKIEGAKLIETIGQIENVVHHKRVQGQCLLLPAVIWIQMEHRVA